MSVEEIQKLLANDNFRYWMSKVTIGDGHCWYHSVCDLLSLGIYREGTSSEILSYVSDEKLFKEKLFDYLISRRRL